MLSPQALPCRPALPPPPRWVCVPFFTLRCLALAAQLPQLALNAVDDDRQAHAGVFAGHTSTAQFFSYLLNHSYRWAVGPRAGPGRRRVLWGCWMKLILSSCLGGAPGDQWAGWPPVSLGAAACFRTYCHSLPGYRLKSHWVPASRLLTPARFLLRPAPFSTGCCTSCTPPPLLWRTPRRRSPDSLQQQGRWCPAHLSLCPPSSRD